MSVESTNFEFNSNGYLANFDDWSKDFALEMANENSIELTDCHWHVIDFLRKYYKEYGIAPDARDIIKQLSDEISPATPCTKKHLEGMFGWGGCKLACKIAGLPDCHWRGV
jgi:tRNA 2-thiouridine synthesizing protein E